ncbi:hypothetical protein CTAYLR_004485 [Chrysophaeum taylorii]|uniref:BolA-like protein n=1 Tax=Chrysophaeum taylorii TaxID=2483200 RepID=A0AAD7UA10_9STRA|nr:hypothetical protein CTAYLR_004485 [Chrysophaeum taylorii]
MSTEVECGQPGCCDANPAEAPIVGDIRRALAALDPTHVSVVDVSDGCGSKLQLVVVSAAFEGKPLLAQHRLVNTALKDHLTTVHAFTLKTYTPTKWAKVNV